MFGMMIQFDLPDFVALYAILCLRCSFSRFFITNFLAFALDDDVVANAKHNSLNIVRCVNCI